MKVKPYSCLIDLDDMSITGVDLPRDRRGYGVDVEALCRCQNRRISGRGSRTVRLRLMVTGGWGHDVYPGLGPLYGGNTLLLA